VNFYPPVFLINAGIVACAAGYLVCSFFHPQAAFLLLRGVLFLCVYSFGFSMYRTVRSPRWLPWIREAAQGEDAPYVFLSVVCLFVGVPNPLIIVPNVIYASVVVAMCAPHVLPNSLQISAFEWLRVHHNDASRSCALIELFLGIHLLFTAPLSLSILYWQFLRFRYTTAPISREAFLQLRQQIDALTTHQYCPGVVRFVWTKFYGFLCRFGPR